MRVGKPVIHRSLDRDSHRGGIGNLHGQHPIAGQAGDCELAVMIGQHRVAKVVPVFVVRVLAPGLVHHRFAPDRALRIAIDHSSGDQASLVECEVDLQMLCSGRPALMLIAGRKVAGMSRG